MTHRMKMVIGVAGALLPVMVLAGSTSSQKSHPSKVAASSSKMHHTEFTLQGVTAENREAVEQIARQAGAQQASLDATSGMLKVQSSKPFNREAFAKMLGEKAQGVTIK